MSFKTETLPNFYGHTYENFLSEFVMKNRPKFCRSIETFHFQKNQEFKINRKGKKCARQNVTAFSSRKAKIF